MKIRRPIAVIAPIVLATALIGSAAEAQRPAPGSFIRNRADSVASLVKQVQTDKTVATRYARHFGMTPEAVEKYFEDNLKLVSLKDTQRVTTYFVSKTSMTMSRAKILAAGSRVFATADGQPVLEWRCGNPLTKKLPAVKQKVVKRPPTPVRAPVVQVAGSETAAVIPPVTPVTPPVVPPVSVLTPPVADVVVPPTVFTPAIEPVIETSVTPALTAVPRLPSMGWVLPALLGAVEVSGSRSHSSQTPEPASMIALGMGISGLVIRRKTKR